MDSSLNLITQDSTKSESTRKIKAKPLIIKKSNLIRADSVLFIKTPTKRSLTKDESIVKINCSNAKKICSKPDVEEMLSVSLIETGTPKKNHAVSSVEQNESADAIDILSDTEDGMPFPVISNIVSEVHTPEFILPCKLERPSMKRCVNHKHLPVYEAEGLVQLNDKFASVEDFINYTYEHAQQWCFNYNMRGHARPKDEVDKNNKTKPIIYGFDCIFHKKKESQSKGIRKVTVFRETNCEARVILKRKYGETMFKVTQVCHHHDHNLTPEEFMKVPNAHRLSPAMKKEIDELLSFDLETQLVHLYVHSKTGMDLRKNVRNRNQVVKKGEGRKIIKEMSPEQMKIVLEKIKYIRSNFVIPSRRLPMKEGFKPKKKKKRIVSAKQNSCDEIEDTGNQDDDWYKQEVVQSVAELQKESFESSTSDVPSSTVENQSSHYSSGEEFTQSVAEEQEESFGGEYGSCDVRLDSTEHAATILPNPNQLTTLSRPGIPQEVSAEIRDLAWFGLDAEIIRRHIYAETGSDLIEYINYTINKIVNRATEPLEVRQDKLDEILVKITQLEDDYGPVEINSWRRDKKKIDKERKASKLIKNTMDSPSRVETRLNNIMSDQQLIDSVEELKRTTGCDIQIQEVDDSQLELEVVDDTEFPYISNENYEDKEEIKNVISIEPTSTGSYELRDIAVQADFELLDLESNYESIQKIEMAAISEDLNNSKYTSNTRGKPKVIEEEAIVNKFNLELYISNFTGVTTCLEDIAAGMNISVLELIKKIYRGEGVFKMTMGRSGQQNRITVQLTYVPLTITFPYEKFKYINSLQEYKAMCSKYLDLAMNLEKVVDNLSNELKQVSQTQLFASLQEEKEKNSALSKQIAQLQNEFRVALQESKARSEELEKLKMRKDQVKIYINNEKTDKNASNIDKEKINAQSRKIALLQKDLLIAMQICDTRSEEIKRLKMETVRIKDEIQTEPVVNDSIDNEDKKNNALSTQIAQLQSDLQIALQKSNARFEEIKLLKMGIKTPNQDPEEQTDAPTMELEKIKKYLQELVIKNEMLAKNNRLLSKRNRELEELRLNVNKVNRTNKS